MAQKFTLTGFKSEWLYLERSGTNLVVRLLPYGRLTSAEWGIRDGVLTISGSGTIDSFSSGSKYPWYSYADRIFSIVVEDGILGIPAYTFEYLENVETIQLPNTLTSLNLNAFQDCGSLNNLVLPASLKTISGTSNTGNPAFIRCESLTDVYYMGTAEEWKTLKNGQRITSTNSDMTLHCLEFVECGATCTQSGPQAHYRFDDQAFGLYGLDKQPISQLETVPALGHRIYVETTETADPLRIENTSSVPFLKEGDTYYSQNHTASSASSLKIIVLHDCTLTIRYGVSSESNYDWLTIMYNSSSTLEKISGVVSNKQITKDLTAGDVLYIGYSKDGSYDKNEDRCWATLIYDPVTVDTCGDAPAENFEPDCENAVICDYCQTVVKAALGHSMSQWTVDAPASCTEDGLRHRSCGRCGDVEEEAIPAGHTYDENHRCTACGAYDQPGGSCGENLDWTLDMDGSLIISGTGEMNGYDDAGNPAPWFEDKDSITSVVIGDGVTAIGDDAFRDSENLTFVVLPDGLTTIGDNAFSGCGNLTDINIPDSVTEIGDGAFQNCDSLTSIILPAGITHIGSDAFADCDSLTDIYYGGTAEQWAELGADVPENVYVHYSCTDPENHWQAGSQDATCTETGYTYEGCACGHQRNIVTIGTALGHYLGNHTIVQKPSCTEPGLEHNGCIRCDYYEKKVIPVTGHSHNAVVIPPTCTEPGYTTHTCHCGDVYTDTPVDALGHIEIIDEAVVATCTETGLTEGMHCDRCDEVLTPQEVIPARGHSFAMADDHILCTACGEKLSVSVAQEYAVLYWGQTLTLDVSPAEFADQIEWSVENEGIVTTAANVLTAAKVGTAYVTATVSAGECRSYVRFRVDVTEVPVEGVQLNTTKATTELYSTDYADLEILLKLPQNYTMSDSQTDVQDNGIAIDSARFTDEALADLFHISILDDRHVQIVPSDYAVENPKLVKSKYTGTITVTVQGEEYETDALTLTVKKSTPKLKAKIAAFNSFYAGQSQPITITGGTPTAIYENAAKNTAKATAIPNWLTLEEDSLVLNENAPKKSVPGKAYLLVETEEWRIPAAVTLSVKNTYKVPGVKLSASSVTVSNLKESAAVELQLLCTNKADTLRDLNITAITVPGGYAVENFNPETGTFTLAAPEGFKSGKLTLKVAYGDVTKSLSLTIKTQDVKLKLSATKLTLNKLTGDQGTITVSCTTKGYDFTKPVIILEDSAKGKLDVDYADGKLTVATNEATQYGKTYKISLRAHADAPASTLTVTIATIAKSEVTVTLKASGKIDVIRDGSAVTVTPTYKNILDTSAVEEELFIYNSQKECVNDLFHIEPNGNGGYTITKAEGAALTAGTYKVKLMAKIGELEIETKEISLKVTMAAPKLTLKSSNTTLFAKDRNDRAVIWFETKDTSLNEIAGVEIKDIKYQDKFEVIDYGNGEFAIGFKGGVDESLIGKSITLNLNVFIEGNQTAKANATAKVKLSIVK